MSNSKSRSPYFYSPLKVQCDQKEVIISHLKEEIYHLQKNQQHFYVLEEQYRNLDHKYRLLSEEKLICDVDFKERHQLALRNICDLKNQIDSLRAEIRDRNLQIGDLQTDQNTLRNQLDQKFIQIERLKNDLASLLADNEQLLNQKIRLEQIANGVRRDNEALLSNLKNTQIDNQSVARKIQDLDKYMSQLKSQDSILRQKIVSYQNQNNHLDGQINNTIEDITHFDTQIAKVQAEIADLQGAMAQISALADKYKSQSLHFQRSCQNQIMKNNQTTKNIAQAQNIFRVRMNQVQEGRKQVANLQGQNAGLDKINEQLQTDLEFCRQHLQSMALLNHDLLNHLQRYSQEDQVVRDLIDRKNRVVRANHRVEDVGKMMLTRSTLTGTSYSAVQKSKVIY